MSRVTSFFVSADTQKKNITPCILRFLPSFVWFCVGIQSFHYVEEILLNKFVFIYFNG